MNISDIAAQARALYAALGDDAEAEAQRRARCAISFGDTATAAEWSRIRAIIRQMRGALAS
ncbi:hypothetical protein HKCCE3408_07190 [Rhodobacterales bacterium HKCCE3408]|nr:hypothetical protein [Rhodobacterales bacterium HKCCE3408]